MTTVLIIGYFCTLFVAVLGGYIGGGVRAVRKLKAVYVKEIRTRDEYIVAADKVSKAYKELAEEAITELLRTGYEKKAQELILSHQNNQGKLS